MARTPEQREKARLYSAKRRKAGLCNSCGKPAVAGKTRCEDHLVKSAAAHQQGYAKRKKLGVCPQCKQKPAVAGRTYCADCLKYHSAKMAIRRQDDDYQVAQKERSARWYQEKVAAGICPQCGERPAVKGKVNCRPCQEDANERFRNLAAERRRIVLAHYGTTCKCCGKEKVPEFLQIDHIDGGGRKHLKEIGQGGLCLWLIKHNFPAGYQTLCTECNFAWGPNRCCPDARDRLIITRVDGKRLLHDPQTGKSIPAPRVKHTPPRRPL